MVKPAYILKLTEDLANLQDYGRIAEISGANRMEQHSNSRFYFGRYFYGSDENAAVGGP